jgi:hypothetical protein
MFVIGAHNHMGFQDMVPPSNVRYEVRRTLAASVLAKGSPALSAITGQLHILQTNFGYFNSSEVRSAQLKAARNMFLDKGEELSSLTKYFDANDTGDAAYVRLATTNEVVCQFNWQRKLAGLVGYVPPVDDNEEPFMDTVLFMDETYSDARHWKKFRVIAYCWITFKLIVLFEALCKQMDIK